MLKNISHSCPSNIIRSINQRMRQNTKWILFSSKFKTLTKSHYILAAMFFMKCFIKIQSDFKPSEKYFQWSKVKRKTNKNLKAKIVQRKNTFPWRLRYWAYWSLTLEKTKKLGHNKRDHTLPSLIKRQIFII